MLRVDKGVLVPCVRGGRYNHQVGLVKRTVHAPAFGRRKECEVLGTAHDAIDILVRVYQKYDRISICQSGNRIEVYRCVCW